MPKRPRHATVVAYVALFFAMGGTAAAATGGTFLIGRSNHATSTTALSDTAGTPLALTAPRSKPPLAVSNAVKVPRLNADLLDGLDSTSLQRRINSSCAPGGAVRAINTAGGVVCTPASTSASCPQGQALQAFSSAGVACVAVSTGSSGPSTPSQGQSKGWVISDAQISTDSAGDFQGIARLTNNTGRTESAFFSITLFNGTTIAGKMTGVVSDVPAGQTFTVDFTSTDAAVAYDTWTFQTDATS